jgi:hypothetical protein
VGAILDDEPPISITDVSKYEGRKGWKPGHLERPAFPAGW